MRPIARAPVNLDEVVAAACEGVGISAEVFRSLLSREDLDDIAAGDIALDTAQACAPSPLATLPRLPPISEGRRQRVLALLAQQGGQYAVAVDTPWRRTDPIILALATPAGTCELHLPRERFDLPAVMKMADGWNTADPCGERGEAHASREPETGQQLRAWYWQSNRYDPKGRCGGTYLAPASDDIDSVRTYLEKLFGVQITELRSPTKAGRSSGTLTYPLRNVT